MEDVINGKSRKDLLQDYIKRKHQLKENMKRNSIKKKSTVPSRIQVKKGKESFKGFSTKPKATKSTFFAELDRKIEEAKFLAKHSVAGARQVFQDIPENLSEANYTTVYWVALAKFEEDCGNIRQVERVFEKAEIFIDKVCDRNILKICRDEFLSRQAQKKLLDEVDGLLESESSVQGTPNSKRLSFSSIGSAQKENTPDPLQEYFASDTESEDDANFTSPMSKSIESLKQLSISGTPSRVPVPEGASRVVLRTIRTPTRDRNAIGTPKVAMPVRRSIRHSLSGPNDEEILKSVEYAYTPNKALRGTDIPKVSHQHVKRASPSPGKLEDCIQAVVKNERAKFKFEPNLWEDELDQEFVSTGVTPDRRSRRMTQTPAALRRQVNQLL